MKFHTMNYIDRQNKLLKVLEEESLDAFLVRKKENISYLVGPRGEDAVLFISGRGNTLITDSRYKEEYAKGLKNCSLRIIKDKNIYESIEDIAYEMHSKRIGFESNNFSYASYLNLKKPLKHIKLIPLKETIENLRVIKDNSEIKYLRTACKNAFNVIEYGLRIAIPNQKETTVRNRIEEYIIKNGFKKAGFDIMVASGRNTSMPHIEPSEKIISKNSPLFIDLGAMYCGYNSDLTRSSYLGRISSKYLHIYNIVLDAQKRAIGCIRHGIKAKDIDAISRQYIIDKRLGKYFIHGLGHGIGLETHEAPNISRNSPTILQEGMVITIEPGIYIPNWGGVRIEDMVLVTETGCEVLTK